MKKLIPYVLLLAMSLMLVVSWRNVITYNARRSKEYDMHIETAQGLEKKEVYVDAIEEYKIALKMRPDQYDVAIKIVELYEALDKPGAYASACEKAIQADPTMKDPYLKLTDYYLESSEFKKALGVLNKAEEKIGEDDSDITERLIKVRSQFVLATPNSAIKSPFYFMDGSKLGYSVVEKDGAYGLMDSKSNMVIPYEYEYVGLLSQKLIPVKKNGEYYYLNENGYRKLVPDEAAEHIGVFNEGYASAAFDGKYGFIDNRLKEYKMKYEYTGGFANGLAAVKQDGKWGVINSSFKNVTDIEFEEIVMDEYDFCSKYGVFFAKKNGKYALYNGDGKKISDEFDEVKLLASDEPAAVRRGDMWGFVSKDGELVVEPSYSDAESFSLGYAPVKIDGKWGCIDVKENVIIEPQFDKMSSFDPRGYSLVETNGLKKYVIVNIYD